MVEIARALSVRSRVLILDEPTSSLSEAETAALFKALGRLRKQGVGIIYISHRLEEVRRIADRITVLRDGKNVGTQTSSELDPRTLVRWMVGRDIKDHFPRPPWNPGALALEVRRLCNKHVHDVNFTLRRGEILGLAGLVGAGRSELARALVGNRSDRVRRDPGRWTARDDRLAGSRTCRRNRPGARGSEIAGPGDDRFGRV